MSETYPKSASAKRFLQNISALQRKFRLQRYNKKCTYASKASIIFKKKRDLYPSAFYKFYNAHLLDSNLVDQQATKKKRMCQHFDTPSCSYLNPSD